VPFRRTSSSLLLAVFAGLDFFFRSGLQSHSLIGDSASGRALIHLEVKEENPMCKWTTAVCLSTVITLSFSLAAQDNASPSSTRKHHHYKLIEIGTFGGATSNIAGPPSRVLTNHGTIIGWAETAMADPFKPNCFNQTCAVQKSFIWHEERRTELPSLASEASSVVFWENDHRWAVGASETGTLDPNLGTPQYDAVLWRNGAIKDLGTLGGLASVANAVNNRGEVAGGASNGVADDPFSMLNSDNWIFGAFPNNTHSHAFVWIDGLLFDLGTLGGPDSMAIFNNDRGQVVGISYLDDVPVPALGGFPAIATFFWQGGEMKNIGGLGGHWTRPAALNAGGEIVGTSLLEGDQVTRSYIWRRGSMKDMGDLGGKNVYVHTINDQGIAAGYSDIPEGTPVFGHPFLWKHGHMTDLGAPKAGFNCAAGGSVNIHAQVVGSAGCNADGLGYPFLWEKSNPIVDLNSLVVPGSGLSVQDAISINDQGEIACIAIKPNGDTRACLLVPLDGEHEWDDDATAGVQKDAAAAGETSQTRIPESALTKSLHTRPFGMGGSRFGSPK